MNLNVVEKLVLCILNKENTNRFLFLNTKYTVSIGASVFMQLFLEDVITLNDTKKIIVKNELNTDKDYLKDVYERIQTEKPKKLKKWIQSSGAGLSTKPLKNILNSVVESLEKQGVLSVTREQGIFEEKVCYTVSEEVVNSIINEIKCDFIEGETLTKECISLTALINQCEVLKKDLSKNEKKMLNSKLKEIKKNNAIEGIKELQIVVDEVQAAIMAAILVSSVN